MRITVQAEGVFLGATKTSYTSKSTGQPGYFYNVAVKQSGEVGNVSCTKELFEIFEQGKLKEYVPCRFVFTFDDRYSRLTVTEIYPLK